MKKVVRIAAKVRASFLDFFLYSAGG